jgi:hypothetical protein
MAVIYSYPVKSSPELTDKMLISDGTDNLTKQVTISGVKDTIDVVDSITATSPLVASASTGAITLSIPAATSGVDGYLTSTNWSTFNGKQPELQSGVNIKTINSNSILGSGNLVISGGAANPAGADTQVQFNSSGSFGASTNLSFSTDRLTLTDTLEIKGDGVNPGTLKLYCENVGTPHAVSILGPVHAGATPYSIRLPKEIATQTAYSSNGRILESDASGALQWIATPTGGGSYSAGDGIDLNGTVFSAGRLTNGGLTISGGKLQVKLNDTDMSGELRAVDGGTGYGTYVVGEMLYAETTSTLAQLSLGTNDKILGVNNGATAPQWITNLVGQEVTTGHMLVGAGTSAMTAIDTKVKGTIAIGNGTTTTALAVGTQDYVLTSRTASATGAEWLQMGTSKMSDYEIGSWTPAPYTATGSAPSTGTCVGYYERIGDIVVVHFYLPITSSSASNVPMMISGLPYTGVTGNGYLGGVSLYANNGTTYIQQQAVSGMVNGAYINLYRFTSTTDYDYTAASWFAQASLSYTIAGTATYRKA